ncbi:hypothetical protein LIER_36673 [Lithospermum erythrorhizon]|uniref:Uncharacterized protein n=1 Tax=Lithospermum erythrorhizon TaxID=34254 RepID=A0AAV3P989_LITER
MQNKIVQEGGPGMAIAEGDLLVVGLVHVVSLSPSTLSRMESSLSPLPSSLEVSTPPLFCLRKIMGHESSFPAKMLHGHHLGVQLLEPRLQPVNLGQFPCQLPIQLQGMMVNGGVIIGQDHGNRSRLGEEKWSDYGVHQGKRK